MNKIAKFSSVFREQFIHDFSKMFPKRIEGITNEEYEEAIDGMYDYMTTLLPKRSTSGSAGYDFYAPFSFDLEPGATVTIPTSIRCEMDEGWVLMIFPRSGLGFKYQCTLANTIGVIDSDYAFADNEGHIMVKLVNRGDKTIHIESGDKFCQGIFIPYGITVDDTATGERHGGFGSTGK